MLNVRPVTIEDAPAMADILAHYVRTSPVTLDTDEPGLGFFEQKIRAIQDFGGPFLVLLAEDGQTVIGYAYGAQYRPKKGYNSSVEISIYLADEATGSGLGKALLTEVLDQCRALGFKLAISVITVDPALGVEGMPSGRMHIAAGFEYIGTIKSVATKFDQFWDTATFTLDLAPDRTAP